MNFNRHDFANKLKEANKQITESLNESVVNEKDYSQFSSKEQHDVRMIAAKWSNAELAQDAKLMKKYMKELVKANDVYIKYIENKKK